MDEQIKCPRCQSEALVKGGFSKVGAQRRICKDCGYRFVGNLFGREQRYKADSYKAPDEDIDAIIDSIRKLSNNTR